VWLRVRVLVSRLLCLVSSQVKRVLSCIPLWAVRGVPLGSLKARNGGLPHFCERFMGGGRYVRSLRQPGQAHGAEDDNTAGQRSPLASVLWAEQAPQALSGEVFVRGGRSFVRGSSRSPRP
jgi:hypothetical protein